jgi:A/G-specific adenine glycosylase
VIPNETESLQSLPGIGRYTAGAIASIAFGRDAPALDGNIRRVFSRLFDISEPIGEPKTERRMWVLAGEHVPPGQAGDFNQALMDLGATVCIPKSPRCFACPLNEICLAYQAGVQETRPVRKKKQPTPHHLVVAAVIGWEDKVLITQRPLDGLLGGLWEFPGGKIESGEDPIAGLKREIMEELGVMIEVKGAFGVYRHAYTHFRVTLHAFLCRLAQGTPEPRQVADLKWVLSKDLAEYPMGKIDRQIANRLSTQVEL